MIIYLGNTRYQELNILPQKRARGHSQGDARLLSPKDLQKIELLPKSCYSTKLDIPLFQDNKQSFEYPFRPFSSDVQATGNIRINHSHSGSIFLEIYILVTLPHNKLRMLCEVLSSVLSAADYKQHHILEDV
jgi:hypothetical protein